MIRNFRHAGLKRLWNGDASRINAALRARIENVLSVLDAAAVPPVIISGNWRVTFRIENGNVFGVDLVDYH